MTLKNIRDRIQLAFEDQGYQYQEGITSDINDLHNANYPLAQLLPVKTEQPDYYQPRALHTITLRLYNTLYQSDIAEGQERTQAYYSDKYAALDNVFYAVLDATFDFDFEQQNKISIQRLRDIGADDLLATEYTFGVSTLWYCSAESPYVPLGSPPAILQNSDLSLETTIASGESLVLPDITITDSNSDFEQSFPAGVDIEIATIRGIPPKTGQAVSYDLNGLDDGAVQAGVSITVTDNGDGSFTSSNGFMWADPFGINITWEDGLAEIAASDFLGHTDWRMPNINEMLSLARYTNNSLLDYAPLNISHSLWSSTTDPNDPGRALTFYNYVTRPVSVAGKILKYRLLMIRDI